jgi:hypothetical protein
MAKVETVFSPIEGDCIPATVDTKVNKTTEDREKADSRIVAITFETMSNDEKLNLEKDSKKGSCHCLLMVTRRKERPNIAPS